MTGERGFRKYRITREALGLLVDSLGEDFRIVGPAAEGGRSVFREVGSSAELTLDYTSTMLPPSKVLFFRPVEEVLRFDLRSGIDFEEVPPEDDRVLALGVHPCDVHAIVYLDRVFAGDPYYMKRRENTLIVALNCTRVDEFCFCSSVGTGPHLDAEEGYDLLLTDLGDFYLAEPATRRGEELVGGVRSARAEDLIAKDERRDKLLISFTKRLDMEGLDGLFLKNTEHPVWSGVADSRCLSCTNCVMVCPTCFCHDVVDETAMDLASARRFRQWDACQDLRFAQVHGANFRRTRASRLRQFVTHKLDYTAQFGAPGTVGCGRCIRWCPTGIDLTEIAGEIQRSPAR
jgi:ferredoxin